MRPKARSGRQRADIFVGKTTPDPTDAPGRALRHGLPGVDPGHSHIACRPAPQFVIAHGLVLRVLDGHAGGKCSEGREHGAQAGKPRCPRRRRPAGHAERPARRYPLQVVPVRCPSGRCQRHQARATSGHAPGSGAGYRKQPAETALGHCEKACITAMTCRSRPSAVGPAGCSQFVVCRSVCSVTGPLRSTTQRRNPTERARRY